MRIFSFVTFLGNLYRLNATRFAFCIRSKARGHFLYVQTLRSFQTPKPLAEFKAFITSAIQALVSDMFEAKVGVKGPHPFQKHWVSLRLKMARSGQGRRRLKIALPFHKAGEKPPLPSAKIRSRYWSPQIFSATAMGFLIVGTIHSLSSAANMAPVY